MANEEHLSILQLGVVEWNRWREENPKIKPDLSEAHLFNESLSGVNFKGVNLKGVILNEAYLKKADLSKTSLVDAKLKNANLARANLSGANACRIDLSDADLTEANLVGINLREADLADTNFIRADLTNAILKQAHLDDADLKEAILKNSILKKASLFNTDLGEALLTFADLSEANLSDASLRRANLNQAKLTKTDLTNANFTEATLEEADLTKAILLNTDLYSANLVGANLCNANLLNANLAKANLSRANLSEANLSEANLKEANLSEADLSNAKLTRAQLVKTNLGKANLTGCLIYGIAAWEVDLTDAYQSNLIVTEPDEPVITVDDIEVAQFIHLLLNNQNIRKVIDTVTSKTVLILGRFTDIRKNILDALRIELRKYNYSPILFDFDKPASRDLTETISTLAHMARFIVADLTDAKSIPHELERIIPELPSVPVQPILEFNDRGYAMFEHFQKYPWVLPPYQYNSLEDLSSTLQLKVINPAENYITGSKAIPELQETINNLQKFAEVLAQQGKLDASQQALSLIEKLQQ